MHNKFLTLSLASALLMGGVQVANAAPESYNFDPTHTNILWKAEHFGFSKPSGRFGLTSGELILDEDAPENSSVEVVIDTTDLVTGIEKFDAHLKSSDFLDVENFPTATFKSTAVEVTGETTAKVTGDLTLHGVTKPVTLDMTLNKIGINPISEKKTAGFSGSIVLKRSDFGISMYVPNVSDEVEISIEAEAAYTAPAITKIPAVE
ncbi:MAG: polyisoprenoid-binding protein [Alphaproteobacteria bacterium]|nr:polyisoprenoid-binding protein [Alphaproteobacteria bacterium]|tara:strand:+ start:6598 stop:7215 length:618 start_codon:yes stop_codon:yes gene_type:complete